MSGSYTDKPYIEWQTRAGQIKKPAHHHHQQVFVRGNTITSTDIKRDIECWNVEQSSETITTIPLPPIYFSLNGVHFSSNLPDHNLYLTCKFVDNPRDWCPFPKKRYQLFMLDEKNNWHEIPEAKPYHPEKHYPTEALREEAEFLSVMYQFAEPDTLPVKVDEMAIALDEKHFIGNTIEYKFPAMLYLFGKDQSLFGTQWIREFPQCTCTNGGSFITPIAPELFLTNVDFEKNNAHLSIIKFDPAKHSLTHERAIDVRESKDEEAKIYVRNHAPLKHARIAITTEEFKFMKGENYLILVDAKHPAHPVITQRKKFNQIHLPQILKSFPAKDRFLLNGNHTEPYTKTPAHNENTSNGFTVFDDQLTPFFFRTPEPLGVVGITDNNRVVCQDYETQNIAIFNIDALTNCYITAIQSAAPFITEIARMILHYCGQLQFDESTKITVRTHSIFLPPADAKAVIKPSAPGPFPQP